MTATCAVFRLSGAEARLAKVFWFFFSKKNKRKIFFFEKKKQETFALFIVLGVAACSSPEPTYYTLQTVPGAVLTARVTSVEVVRPGLAGYLDRSGIVLKQSDYRLDVDSQVRWGEPLGDMIGRVLAQDLTQRLPGTSVFSGDGAIGADADMRVEVNVEKFDAEADGSVSLVANLAIMRGLSHAVLAAHSVSLRYTDVMPGPEGLAAAMSALLGQLADQAAADIARR